MTRSPLDALARHARALAAGHAGRSDVELLARFAGLRDEAAFAELVARHGPMVWAACRHLLPNPADAEDAFQVTFLALARSAGTVRAGSAVGGWLHGVAVRAAAKLRRSAARRRRREEKVAGPVADRPVPDAAWGAALAAFHEEVARLPDAQRAAIVLCDLEGIRPADAAVRLGVPEGTLHSSLSRARRRLLARLAGRGIAPAAAVGVGASAAVGAVPAGLVGRVVASAGAGAASVPPAVLELLAEVTPMTVNRAKMIAAAALVAGGLAVGVGSGWLASAGAQTSGPPAAAQPAQPASTWAELLAQAAAQPPGSKPATSAGGEALRVWGFLAANEASRPAAKWEYRYLPQPAGVKRAEFEAAIAEAEAGGWTLVGVADLRWAGDRSGDPLVQGGATQPTLVFRRPAGWGPDAASALQDQAKQNMDAYLQYLNALGTAGGKGANPPSTAGGSADDKQARRLEAQIRDLQEQLAKLKPSEATHERTIPQAELPLGVSELADVLRRLAVKKYGYERLTFAVTSPVAALVIRGDREAVEWALGVIRAMSGK